jgi:hypothetical protein
MSTDGVSRAWLLFLAQLPSSPSSARVALWRRLHAIGAAGILNGSWVLPHTAAHVQFFEQLQETVHKQGGRAFVLTVSELSPDTTTLIVQQFRADRSREYDEFTERCDAFLTEISKETRAGKFTFAELEEGEQDLEKLVRWLTKIQARDFIPDERWPRSDEMLVRCRRALDGFSQEVYAAGEVQAPPGGAAEDNAGQGGGDACDA